MLLLADLIEATYGAESSVILESAANLFRQLITHFKVGSKLKAAFGAWSFECAVESWVEREIPATGFFVDDGANFPGPRIG